LSWKLADEVDQEIRRRMKARSWEVTPTNYNTDREIYAWWHDVPSGPSPTLRISRRILEDYPAFVVLHQLDTLKVAQAIRAQPEARLAVVQDEWKVVLKET
jgi:hypothetical protein